MATTTKAPTKRGARDQGKSSFAKEHLNDHPYSNPAAVNAAWQEAGMEGTISPSIVNKVRAEMKLTGNLRKGRKPTSAAGKNAKAKAKATRAGAIAVVKAPARGAGDLQRLGRELDAELDRLIFKVMDLKALADVEDGLRDARMALYRVLHARRS